MIWEYSFGNDEKSSHAYSSPALGQNGLIYLMTWKVLWTFDMLTGIPQWNRTKSAGAQSSPAFGPNGTLYIMNGNSLWALDGMTGELQWEFNISRHGFNGNYDGTPVVGNDGTVYIGLDTHIVAIDPSNLAAPKWEYNLTNSCSWFSIPALGSNGLL
jgi:outer membrane protein assembly factor BamB